MDPSPNEPPDVGYRRNLWSLGLVLFLLVIIPASLAGRVPDDQRLIQDPSVSPVATMFDELIDNSQKSALFVVAALAFLSFGKLAPILWSLFQASMAGLLIAAEFGVVFWLVYGGLASIGMPGLFWSPDRWTMMQTGMAVTLLVYWLLYLVFVRDFEVHRRGPDDQVWARFRPVLVRSGFPALFALKTVDADAVVRLRWFLAYAGLPALIVLAVPAVLPAVRPGDGPVIVEWAWLAGMALGVFSAAVLVWTRAATRFHELWRQLWRGSFDFRQIRYLDPNRLDPNANTKNILVIVGALLAVSYIEEALGLYWMRLLFPPAFCICVMLGVVATFATFVSTRPWRTRVAVASALLALLALAGMLDYEVEIRDLRGRYPSAYQQLRRQLAGDDTVGLTNDKVVNMEHFQRGTMPEASAESFKAREDLLGRWARSFQKPSGEPAVSRKPILVVVTTSGGALRAAIWTETVLGYLDQKIEDFPHHVRLITGASGGMLGAARYVSGHNDGTGVVGAPGRALKVPDYLTPIAWQIALRDFFPNCLFPWATYNRGDALEDAWIEYDGGISHTFGEIKGKEDQGLIPSLVFSPMLVEDGRRLLISNLPLHDLAVIGGEALLGDNVEGLRDQYLKDNATQENPGHPDMYDLEYPDIASVSAVEFFRLFGEPSRQQLKLASAVRMSATFPYVTSSVTLPTDPPRHVVDAGYYDNYGVNLATAWIASHRAWIKDHAAGVLVVQVRAFRNEKRLKVLSEQIQAAFPTETGTGIQALSLERVVRFFPWLVSLVADGVQSVVLPLEGVAKARDSSMYFRNDEQLRGLQRMFTELTHHKDFFRSVIFTCDTIQVGQEAQNVETLNWYIDHEEFDQIRHNMEPYQEMDSATQTGIGRDRNDMRVKGLLDWWTRRGGTPKK